MAWDSQGTSPEEHVLQAVLVIRTGQMDYKLGGKLAGLPGSEGGHQKYVDHLVAGS